MNTSIYLIAKENIEINKGETLSFCKPYIISILDVVAVRTIANVTQRVIFMRIDIISSTPVLYILKLRKFVKISPLPLLTNGKNKANNIKGISIESRFKYVLSCNFETINNPATINACKTIETLFSKLKKAIERIIAKKEINFISGLIFTKYESLCVSK